MLENVQQKEKLNYLKCLKFEFVKIFSTFSIDGISRRIYGVGETGQVFYLNKKMF